MGHVTLTLFAVVLFLTSPDLRVAAEEGRYPQDALECYASSALQSQKEGRIICPPGKSHRSPKSVPVALPRRRLLVAHLNVRTRRHGRVREGGDQRHVPRRLRRGGRAAPSSPLRQVPNHSD